MGMEEARPKVIYSLRENVKVIEGPFQNFVGFIDEINAEKQKLKVLVNMFGRETPVELDFEQVEKM